MATQPQPPVTPPTEGADTQYGPAPVDQNTPYQQQPVNQQYFAQPQAAPVQYVVMAQSLKGVRGWLLFFTVSFAIAGLGYIGTFFASMGDDNTNIVNLLFMPVLAGLSLAATVTIAMEKKIGKWLGIAVCATVAVHGAINTIVQSSASGETAPMIMSGIVAGIVSSGLMALYFFVSRRVKETLIK